MPSFSWRRWTGFTALEGAGFSFVLLLGLVAVFHPALFSGFRLMMTDPGDTRFVQYLFEHSWLWVTQVGGHESYWDAPFFHPVANAMAYSETMLGTAPVYWLFRALRFPPDTAFPLWQLSVFSLNFTAMWALLRRGAGFRAPASLAGAYVFAFGAPRVNQLFHVQMAPQFMGVLTVLALLRLGPARGGRAWAWALLCGLGLAGQLFAGFYAGWFFGFGLLGSVLVGMAFPESRRVLSKLGRDHGLKLLGVGALAALALTPMMSRYLAASHLVGGRTFPQVDAQSLRPLSWVYLGSNSWLYGWLGLKKVFLALPNEHEQRLGIGFLTPLFVLLGFFLSRKKVWALPLLISGGLLFFFATHWSGRVTPWALPFTLLPGASAIRAQSRIGELLLFVAAFGLAGAIEWVTERPRGVVLALGVGAGVVLEQGVTQESFDVRLRRELVHRIAAAVPAVCDSFFFAAEKGWQSPNSYQLDAMWAGIERGVPTLNGYSAWTPPRYQLSWNNLLNRKVQDAVYEAFGKWETLHALPLDRTCWVQLPVSDSPVAEFLQVRAQRRSERGKTMQVLIRVRNPGLLTWQQRDGYALALARASQAAGWTMEHALLPHPIPHGERVDFEVKVRAPSQSGPAPLGFEMVVTDRVPFGAASEVLEVEVVR